MEKLEQKLNKPNTANNTNKTEQLIKQHHTRHNTSNITDCYHSIRLLQHANNITE